jgi:hypothetical protein
MTGKDSALRDAVIAAKRWSGDLELFLYRRIAGNRDVATGTQGPVDQRL